jgi:hypothetical protein
MNINGNGGGCPDPAAMTQIIDILEKERKDREQADLHLDRRIRELDAFTRDVYTVVRREALVLRCCVIAFTMMSFAAQFGYVHHLSGIFGLICGIILLYNWLMGQRWVQRRMRDTLIAWDTWRLKRSR